MKTLRKYRKKSAVILMAMIISVTMPAGAVFATDEQLPEASETTATQEATTEAAEQASAEEETTETDLYTEGTVETEEEAEAEPANIIGDHVEGELLVVYDNKGMSASEAADVADVAEESISNAGAEVSKEVLSADGSRGTLVVAKTEDGVSAAEAIGQLEDADGVKGVQPNYKYYINDDTEDSAADTYAKDPYNSDVTSGQYYLYRTKAARAWDSGVKTEGKVSVAVLDTGCRLTHEDIKDNLVKNPDSGESKYLAWDASNDEPIETSVSNGLLINGGDLQGHGTHVCGIIGASAGNGKGIAGVSYNAGLIPVNVFTRSASGSVYASSSDIIAAYNYLDNIIHTGKVSNLHVINMSLGSIRAENYVQGSYYYDNLVESAIASMRKDHNVLTVCAGGNGEGSSPYVDRFNFPSDFDACLAVTALDENNKNVSYSDYNKYKDISAPGKYIVSTTCKSNSSYGSMSGTSQASPIVAGIAALMWSQDSSLSASDIVRDLKKTALPITDDSRFGRYKNNSNPEEQGSAGAVNAEGATLLAMGKSDIGDCSISLEKTSYTYTGKDIQPKVTVLDMDGNELVAGQDYTLTYSNNRLVGTASATVTGKGDYGLTAGRSFTINPVATKISSISAYSKALKVKWYKKSTQVTGYQIALSKSSSFSGTVYSTATSYKTTYKKVSKLSKKKRYYVKIRTYKTVGSKKYYSSWSAVKTKTTK